MNNCLNKPTDTILKPHTLKLFLLPLVIATLSACDTQPVKPEQESIQEPRTVTEKQATLTEEAESLLERAEDSDTDAEQFKYRTLAAKLYIEAGANTLARNLLQQLKDKQTNRPATDKTRLQTETAAILLLSSDLAISENNQTVATELLDKIKPVSREQQIYFYQLKANLDVLSGNYMYAVDRRVQLDSYITNKEDKNKNNKKIWAALSNMSTTQLKNQRSSNQQITGWLDLAAVVRASQNNIGKLEDDLLNWGTRYPSHSANDRFLQELIDIYQTEANEQRQLAVILPMHGDLSKISENIKNGILSAYYHDTDINSKTVINFYDSSNTELTFKYLYRQAIDQGATNIIGPLDKEAINRLTREQSLDVPVLTLNYAENTFNTTENLFQFGLSPEDEARQVAELAIKQGKLRAAVFYPDSEWGKRLSQAFSSHYTNLGGKVETSSDYAVNTNDYRRPIRSLFNLDQSTIRHRKVENTISKRAVSVPRRRQDIDMIFLAATPRSARSIMPAFKFHHASALPVYSTSHVYGGTVNKELDRDLNGLMFCDLPWVLQNNSPLKKTFSQNWPAQENFTRLFALGIDAYHLIYNIEYLENKDYAYYDGQTGNIHLDENNRVTRKLLWAKFERGKPVYFEPAKPESKNSEN